MINLNKICIKKYLIIIFSLIIFVCPKFLLSQNIDEKLYRIRLVKEPEYTKSDSNWIFFDPLPDKIPINYIDYPKHLCDVEIIAYTWSDKGDSIFVDKRIVSADSDSALFLYSNSDKYKDFIGQRIYYKAHLLPTPVEKNDVGPWSKDSVYSTQDTIGPEVYWTYSTNHFGQLVNKYQKKQKFEITLNITDPSGIDSVFLIRKLYPEANWNEKKICLYPDDMYQIQMINKQTVAGTKILRIHEGYWYMLAKDSTASPRSHYASNYYDERIEIKGNTTIDEQKLKILQKIYIFPNPLVCTGINDKSVTIMIDKIFIKNKYKQNNNEKLRCNIFDMFGKLVITLYPSNNNTNSDVIKYSWDGKRKHGNFVETGGYLAVIKGVTGENAIGQIFILRKE